MTDGKTIVRIIEQLAGRDAAFGAPISKSARCGFSGELQPDDAKNFAPNAVIKLSP
jgi:hypothetical protein